MARWRLHRYRTEQSTNVRVPVRHAVGTIRRPCRPRTHTLWPVSHTDMQSDARFPTAPTPTWQSIRGPRHIGGCHPERCTNGDRAPCGHNGTQNGRTKCDASSEKVFLGVFRSSGAIQGPRTMIHDGGSDHRPFGMEAKGRPTGIGAAVVQEPPHGRWDRCSRGKGGRCPWIACGGLIGAEAIPPYEARCALTVMNARTR